MINNGLELLRTNWREALVEKNFGRRYVINFIVCFLLYIWLSRILFYNRLADGVVLNDPILMLFKPYNFSIPLFVLMYTSILLFMVYITATPRLFVPTSRMFVLLFAFRVGFILLLPLKPPTDMITLNDPFIDKVAGFNMQVCNDLFFSGHEAILCFFIFCTHHKSLKSFFIIAALLVAIMLAWQKVHYVADLIAAPFFAYTCYSLIGKISRCRI